jgi:maleylacetoacetate isomerase
MKLYSYWRSSAAYRVRIALNLKGLDTEIAPINLREGAQSTESYRGVNPQALVPALEIDDALLTQSLAIIEYLDESHPEPPFLPSDPADRARVRAFAQAIACDIHPLNNLRVLNYLRQELDQDKAVVGRWYCHWIAKGLGALEEVLNTAPESSTFCFGERPGLADICLIPQLYNAHRFECDVSHFRTLRRIEETCLALPPFAEAAPDKQPDAG